MASQIQLRRDTAANWASVNPTLAQGELGVETDTGKIKLGTGSTAWNSLSYFVGNLPGATLDSIGDVTITSAQNGDFLRYNGSASVWINDPVNLATDTVGNYVESLVAGTGVTLSNNSGEGSTPTIAIGQEVATSSSVTFAHVLGNVTGNVTGNASTATALQTPRTISLSGDVSGSVSFNGTSNAEITTTIQPNSIALGTDTSGNYMSSVTAGTGVQVSHTPGEGSEATISIGQDVGTGQNVTFAGATIDAVRIGVATANTIDTTSGNLTIDSSGGTTTIADNLIVDGTLTVSGSVTVVNTQNLQVGDAIITLNHDETGAPSENAGIEVERGTSTNVFLQYNETSDKWELTNDGTAYSPIETTATVNTSLKQQLWLNTVYAATTVALPNSPSYTAGTTDLNSGTGIGAKLTATTNGTLQVDGAPVPLENRILVKNQANALHNGIYKVTATGSASATWELTRASDFDNSTSGQTIYGKSVRIATGTVNALQVFAVTSAGSLPLNGLEGMIHVIGTDPFTWTQVSGKATLIPGNGLQITNNELSLPTISQSNTASTSGDTNFIKSINVDSYGRLLGVTTNDVLLGLGTNTMGDYVQSISASVGTGITVSGTGEGAVVSVGSNATPNNTLNAIVMRDGSGNFSAGTITAELSGNASTANTLYVSRVIELTGDVSGSVSFDGSANASITTTIQPNSVALGTDTTGNYVSSLVAGTGIALTNNSGESATPTVALDATLNNLSDVVIGTVYSVGDTGPAGGVIFITPNTSGNTTGKYFESSPSSAEVIRKWASPSNVSTFVSGADGTAIGTGEQNTIDIVAQSGNVAGTCAAVYASEYSYGGYSDWFLPSQDELVKLYISKALVGGLENALYHSSTESDNNAAIYLYASVSPAVDGTTESLNKNSDPVYVRPVRSFSPPAASSGDFLKYDGSEWVNDPINLGTDTVGNYMSDLTQGTGVTITHTPGEGSNATIAIGQAVATSSSVTFAAVTAPLVGNASTASALQTARDISLTGDVSGSVSFDGSANASITATIQPNSVALGTDTTGNYMSDLTQGTGVTITHTPGEGSNATIAIGQAVGTSSSVTFAHVSAPVTGNVTGNVTGSSGSTTGNAATATKLATARTIELTGDVTGTVSFDGSANASISTTIGANSVALGTDTTGNYVNDITAGTGITVTHTPAEGSSPTIAIGQAVGTSSSVTFARVETTGNLVVGGDLSVTGTLTTVNETNLAIEDTFIYLNDGSTTTNPDLGWAGNYNDGTYKHAGLFRDATDGKFKFFDSYTLEPTDPINVGHASYSAAPVVAELFESTVTTGIAPFSVSSSTVVTNFNADKLDGQDGSYYLNTSSTLDDISNVSASAPVDDSPLVWSSSASAWVANSQNITLGVPGTTDYLTIGAASGITMTSATEGNIGLSPNGFNATSSSGNYFMIGASNITFSNGTDSFMVDPFWATSGQVLAFTPSGSGLGGTFGPTTPTLDFLSDVSASAPTSGDFLKWNGSAWVNASGVVTTSDSGTVTSTMIADATIVNNDISASAGIELSKLATSTAGNIIVYNSSGVPTSVTETGDVTISDTGVTAIASGVIVNADVSASAAIDLGKLADVSTNAQTASYTLVLADKNKIVEMGVGSANNLTVPLNSSVAFPIGSQINILQTGTGQTTIVATGGVTINATPGLKMRAQWSYATLVKRAENTWVLVGDISA